MSYMFSFTFFFFTAAHFHFALVAASISHFFAASTKVSSCSSNDKMSPLFFSSRSRFLSLLSFAGLSPTFSFSCSIFQICGHGNVSKLNNLDNTDTETISAFRFRLHWLLSVLYKTPVAVRSPAKIASSCIWVAIPVNWVILHWYACGADRRSLGQCTVTWLLNFLRWVDYFIFLPMVLRWGASRARNFLWMVNKY